MGVTQYIGARYVPLFADPAEWNKTRTYEPLTIVLHNGSSYTSKQFVPIGIDIDNTEFWALTGNYNAQVEQYRQEVLRYDGRITQNAEQIAQEATKRKNADDALQQSISDEATKRKNADDALEKKINDASVELNKKVQYSTEFFGKNALFISDSWGVVSSGLNITKPYPEILADITGMNIINLSLGSTGFIYKGDRSTFVERLLAWANDSQNDTDSINYIFVCGSSNDYASTSEDIKRAVISFIDQAVAKYKNAEVVIIPQWIPPNPLRASVSASDNNLWRKTHIASINAYNAYIESNLGRRIRLINGTNYAMRFMSQSIYMNNDMVHPTQKGQTYLAYFLFEMLKGNTPQSMAYLNANNTDLTIATYTGGSTLTETLTPTDTVCNIIWKNSCLQGQYKGTFSITKTGATSIQLRHPGFMPANEQTQKLDFIAPVTLIKDGEFIEAYLYWFGSYTNTAPGNESFISLAVRKLDRSAFTTGNYTLMFNFNSDQSYWNPIATP